MSVNVQTFGTGKIGKSDSEIAEAIRSMFDLRPKAIEYQLSLRQPMYEETAAYGHVGRKCTCINKTIEGVTYGVGLFTWEALGSVPYIKESLKI